MAHTTLNKMSGEDKLHRTKQPVPFASSFFIAWRIVNGKRVGRMVIDMRPVNTASVPDAYPLPNQEEILNALIGSEYFTVMDGSSFYHQLPVWRGHRNRMALISHRRPG